MSNRHNLDKLKELCKELSDRDEQLKVNASALWQILEVASDVSAKLGGISTSEEGVAKKIESCIETLDKINCIITEKGCKRVLNDH